MSIDASKIRKHYRSMSVAIKVTCTYFWTQFILDNQMYDSLCNKKGTGWSQ